METPSLYVSPGRYGISSGRTRLRRRISAGSRPRRRAPRSMSRSITNTASGRPAARYAAFSALLVTTLVPAFLVRDAVGPRQVVDRVRREPVALGRVGADVGKKPVQGDGLTANTVNHLPGPYRVPHYRNAGTSVVTTKAVNAAYRAAGRPEAVFVMERLMDIGARRLGLDPAEIRRRNFVRPAEMPYRPGLTYKDGVAVTYDPGDFPAAFEKALALLPYEEWRRRQKALTGGTRRIG